MEVGVLTVGKLAEQTGVSIRTLHYYDEIDLLNPSRHTEGGYGVYTSDDLGRLKHALMLRQLGFSLAEVRQRLDAPQFSPPELIHNYVVRLQEHIARQHELCERLQTSLYSMGETNSEDLLKTIRAITSLENCRDD